MNFIFCKLRKPQKTWISFFCKLKEPQKIWITFFGSLKTSKNMNFIFYKLKKPQKRWISFFANFTGKNQKHKYQRFCGGYLAYWVLFSFISIREIFLNGYAFRRHPSIHFIQTPMIDRLMVDNVIFHCVDNDFWGYTMSGKNHSHGDSLVPYV